MQDSTLLQEGLMLMAFGMGFVFVFLTILVFATSLMSRVVARLVPTPAKVGTQHVQTAQFEKDDTLLVAISAALHRHRRRDRDTPSS